MAITYSTAAKNARLTAVRDLIDAGTGPGLLEIGTSGMATVLAQFILADPCGTVSGGVLSFSGFPNSDASANATGTAAAARIRDSNSVDIITGLTVGTGSADIVLDSVSITSGQTVTLNSAAITHAP